MLGKYYTTEPTCIFCFETGSLQVAQSGLELANLLSLVSA